MSSGCNWYIDEVIILTTGNCNRHDRFAILLAALVPSLPTLCMTPLLIVSYFVFSCAVDMLWSLIEPRRFVHRLA